ncbi:hypothetical protein Hamer_G000396, partial [Homarus americanus]
MDNTDQPRDSHSATEIESEERISGGNKTVFSAFHAEQNGRGSPKSAGEESGDRMSELSDSLSPHVSQTSGSHAPQDERFITNQSELPQDLMDDDGGSSEYSDEEDFEEDGEGVGEEEMVSEEDTEDLENKEKAEEVIATTFKSNEQDGESKKSSLSLYSGMSDIISESARSGSDLSPTSCSSTPSLSPGKTPQGGMSRQQTLPSSLIHKSGGGGLLVHHPVTPKKRVITKTKTDHLSDELNLGYRIMVELMSDYQKGSNAPFMDPIEIEPTKNKDYMEVVKKPLWLRKIKEDLLAGHYQTITEVIGDLRIMLENAYRYYGPVNAISKKGLRLEHMMEQKIALLPKEVRELCTLEKTSGQPPEDITQKHRNKTAKISVNGDNFFSYVLYRVRGCRVQREKDLKKRRMEAMRQAKRDREQEVVEWEKDLMKEPIYTHMRAMWELPQIGHFIVLTLKTLNIYEVPQYELERMLLMPRASRTLAMLLTSLLSSPQQRQKLNEKPYMPYKVWARKLAHKTLLWYRCYYRENRDPQKVFDQMGIEPEFWRVCGPTNPFDRQLFHEMTYHQRVWLLKSLCDFLLHNHKTVQEVIAEQTEADQREYHLGHDRDSNDYLHFPQFCGQDLRIYRRARVPSPEITLQVEETVEGSVLPLDKIKEHRKMMRKFRHKYEEEAEWEGSRGKKRKRKRGRGRGRAVNPEEEVGLNSRSRPGNLRQRPRARYNDQFEDLGLSSDEEPKIKSKGKRSWVSVIDSSSECESERANERPSSAAAGDPEEDEGMGDNSPAPSQQEGLTRAQQKNPRTKRGGKKQRLALSADDIPVSNKRSKLDEIGRENLEEQTDNGADRLSSERDTCIVENGECEPEEKKELKADSDRKVSDLISESLMNGRLKDETLGNSDDKDGVKVCGVPIVSNIKNETEEKTVKEALEAGEENVKTEKLDNSEDDSVKTSENQESLSCNGSGVKKEELEIKEEESEHSEDESNHKSPSPPKELPPIHDSSPYLPRVENFELVVTSVEQLRALIQKFGDLPEGSGGDEENGSPKKSKEEGKKRPSCEVKLHYALCNLLSELSPWESKLLSATKRDPDYVDPAEEAWMSDPEPEPEPPPPPAQESSSSSSSSEESLDEDGNTKRKLRKRRVKRHAASQLMESVAPPVETTIVASEESSESYTVTSRGRVRKVKKMINYDGLDFEKLAIQASEEAEQERVRKRRKREEEEKKREEQEAEEESLSSQPSGVRRYLLSHTGHVMGYIDNDGQVHSGSVVKDPRTEKGKVDISSVRNLASQLVTNAKKEGPQTPLRTGVMIPKKTVQNSNMKPGVPTVVVAAINSQGSPVYFKVVGEQALQLVKYMRPSVKGPVSQIKLQHHGQTYTVNSNAHMITHNIPGLPDGEATEKPTSSVSQSPTTVATPTSSLVSTKPSTGLEGLATSNSPSVPRVAPITSVVNSVSSQPNTLALAYRGMTKPTRPMTVNAPVRPRSSIVPGAVIHQDANRHSSVAPTRLVTASPSVVSSVMPPSVNASSSSTHNLINVNQPVNRQPSASIIASPRPQVTPVVNRISVSSSGTSTNIGAMPQQSGTPVMQHHVSSQQQVITAQAPTAVAAAPSQPLGQTVTATTIAVPGPGGQPQVQLKLESESLAQLMQRTGSKIVALPNGRGGYTLSLTPGVVQPGQVGQKNQTHITANAAAKVQVVSCSTTPLLQENVQPQAVQQPQVIQQQSQVISQGVAGVAAVGQQQSSAQQIGVRQVIPVTQAHPPGTIIKDANVGTQVVVSGQQAIYSRVGTQQRVYNQLVTSPQGTRCVPISTTNTIASQQSINNSVNTSQSTGVVQKVNTVASQSPSYQTTQGQQQYVVQQRVVAAGNQATIPPHSTQTVVQQGTTAYKPVVLNQSVQQGTSQVVRVAQAPVIQQQQQQQQQQIVRLQPVSGNHPTGTSQKLVQIVQSGAGRQVVQMVQQVVASNMSTICAGDKFKIEKFSIITVYYAVHL